MQNKMNTQSKIKELEQKVKELQDMYNNDIDNINQKLIKLSDKIDNIDNKNKEDIFTSFYISEKYEELDDEFRKKLLDGNTLIGVKSPKYYYIKNKPKEETTYTMCFFYKSGKCKDYVNIKLPYDENQEYLLSKRADFIHLSQLAKIKYRNISVNDLGKEITKYMMCAKCAKNCGIKTNLLFNYTKKKNLCYICKHKVTSKNIGDQKLCSDCNRCSGIGNEHFIIKALEPVAKMFNKDMKTILHNNYTVHYDNDRRSIDILISGEWNNKVFYIMVEKDENKHIGYNKESEIKKMVTQIKGIVKNEANCILFRYSSTGKVDGNTHNFDNHMIRLIVLRQWIILYITLILKNKQPDNVVIIYLWYDKFNTEELQNYMEKKYKIKSAILQTNLAPANNNNDNNSWTYAFDPSEKNIKIILHNTENCIEFCAKWYLL